jgi:hypothetical protein
MPKLPPRPVVRRENDVTAEARGELAHADVLHWRNTVGFIRKDDVSPRSISYGLCPGSADLIAVVPTALDCPHCGVRLPPIGRFVGIELKGPTSRPDADRDAEQRAWGRLVEGAHGVYGVVFAGGEVVHVLQRARSVW